MSVELSWGDAAQRLAQDGIVEETAMQDAISKSKEKRVSLVSQLGRRQFGDRAAHRALGL
jgi:hypothetical protein